MLGSTDRKITIQDGSGIKQNPISKITNTKRAGRVGQMIECLPSKQKVLYSTPHTAKIIVYSIIPHFTVEVTQVPRS
jgi:hypothetical protein